MITLDTAAQLEALALTIFDSHTDPLSGASSGLATGLTGDDPAIDAQYLTLIAPVMLVIDGRVMEPGFRYTLNFTCASKGRPKHWFMGYLSEHNLNNSATSWGKYPAECGLVYVPNVAAGFGGGVNSSGFTLANAMCAAVCRAWAAIIRMWLAGNYPMAVTQPN